MTPAVIRTLAVAALAAIIAPHAGAQGKKLNDLRDTMELVFMCSVRNDTTPRVRRYFESAADETLQREWNRAIGSAQRQMSEAQKRGGQAAVRAMQRYDLSCALLDTVHDLPVGLQSALHK